MIKSMSPAQLSPAWNALRRAPSRRSRLPSKAASTATARRSWFSTSHRQPDRGGFSRHGGGCPPAACGVRQRSANGPGSIRAARTGTAETRGHGPEVTLLPRHWDWLNAQPGGASVALRKLVDQARHGHAGRDRVRQAQEVTYRFMSVVAGNLYGYEEAMRALFAATGADSWL